MNNLTLLNKINIFMLFSVFLLSILFIIFGVDLKWYYLYWIIIQENTILFIHTPFLFLIFELIFRRRLFREYSILYLVINSFVISVLSYIIFYIVVMILVIFGFLGG